MNWSMGNLSRTLVNQDCEKQQSTLLGASPYIYIYIIYMYIFYNFSFYTYFVAISQKMSKTFPIPCLPKTARVQGSVFLHLSRPVPDGHGGHIQVHLRSHLSLLVDANQTATHAHDENGQAKQGIPGSGVWAPTWFFAYLKIWYITCRMGPPR